MRLTPELVDEFYRDMKPIRRASWPEGDHILADGSEKGMLWYYSHSEDELMEGYGVNFHDLAANDWEYTNS